MRTVGDKIKKAEKLGVVYFESSFGGRRCTIAQYYSIRIPVFSGYRPVFKNEKR